MAIGDWTELADAFNTAVKAREDAERQAAAEAARLRRALEAERARRVEVERAARARLVDELAAFGERIDAVRVERTGEGLVLATGSRAVAFEPARQGGFLVVGLPDEAHLDRDVDGAWVLSSGGRHLPLLPHGITEILVEGLGLPRPGGLPPAGPPRIKRVPRLNTGILPPRPPGPRDE